MQAQFSQMRPVAIAPAVGPRMPMYPPGAPGIGQQIFYGQGPPAMIPPQVCSLLLFITSYLFTCFFVNFLIFVSLRAFVWSY